MEMHSLGRRWIRLTSRDANYAGRRATCIRLIMVTYAQPAVNVLHTCTHRYCVNTGAPVPGTDATCSLTFFLSCSTNYLITLLFVHGHSDCAKYIIANVADGTAYVRYNNGRGYLYTNVSRRALLNACDERQHQSWTLDQRLSAVLLIASVPSMVLVRMFINTHRCLIFILYIAN